MDFRKVFSKRIRRQVDGVQIASDMNAVVSANVGKRGSSSHVSSKQRSRAVQRSGKREPSDEAKEAEANDTQAQA